MFCAFVHVVMGCAWCQWCLITAEVGKQSDRRPLALQSNVARDLRAGGEARSPNVELKYAQCHVVSLPSNGIAVQANGPRGSQGSTVGVDGTQALAIAAAADPGMVHATTA